jgi:hypothetical protein
MVPSLERQGGDEVLNPEDDRIGMARPCPLTRIQVVPVVWTGFLDL